METAGDHDGVMNTIEDVACTVCGCVCDDLRITVENGRITRTQGACDLAEPWFLAQESRNPPAAEIEGSEVAVSDALSHAARLGPGY